MPQAIRLRGAKLLKVVGIIMIIFGALNVGGGFISLGSNTLMSSVLGLDEYGLSILSMLSMIAVFSGAIMLVFGIFGVKCAGNPDRVGLLILLGIILLIEAVFSSIYNNAMAPAQEYVTQQILDATLVEYGVSATNSSIAGIASSPIMMGIGFVLPVLFLIGALLNKLPPKIIAIYPVSEPDNYGGAEMPQLEGTYAQEAEEDVEPRDDDEAEDAADPEGDAEQQDDADLQDEEDAEPEDAADPEEEAELPGEAELQDEEDAEPEGAADPEDDAEQQDDADLQDEEDAEPEGAADPEDDAEPPGEDDAEPKDAVDPEDDAEPLGDAELQEEEDAESEGVADQEDNAEPPGEDDAEAKDAADPEDAAEPVGDDDTEPEGATDPRNDAKPRNKTKPEGAADLRAPTEPRTDPKPSPRKRKSK